MDRDSLMLDRFGELADTPDDARELVQLFLANTSEDLDSLGAAMHAGNICDAELIAHRCAGASGVCGVTDLMDLLRQIEERAHSGDLRAAAIVLPTVSATFDRVRRILSARFVPQDLDSVQSQASVAHVC